MPGDLSSEVQRMLMAGALVAAVAVPVGLAGWFIARARRQPLLPAWKPWRVPWTGFEVVAAFLVLNFVVGGLVTMGLDRSGFYQQVYGPDFPPMAKRTPVGGAMAAVAGVPSVVATQTAEETRNQLRGLWAHALALPIQLGFLFAASRFLYPEWRSRRAIGISPGFALAVGVWLLLTPLTLAFNFAVNLVFSWFDAVPESHPLTRLAGRPALDSALFVFQATIVGPMIEEVVFRGLILAWMVGGWTTRSQSDIAPRVRPWLVVFAGVLFAVVFSGQPGPLVFSVLLAGGLGAVLVLFRSKRRVAGGVYSSAAFFAMVHASVWPSPIPLFLLGLVLGWFAIRTRGVFVPFVVHGLFNAVSAVFVLRGA